MLLPASFLQAYTIQPALPPPHPAPAWGLEDSSPAQAAAAPSVCGAGRGGPNDLKPWLLVDPGASLPLFTIPCPQINLQRAELQSLREELQRQKELRTQEDPEEALSGALSDRDEAVNK